MVITDTVLEIIARKGPVIPANVAKEIGQNLLMSGAVLSELSSRNKVKVSAVKVGGSPLYYLPGQEEMLLNYIGNLDKNEQRTVERLKGQGVIRESHSDPLTRYTLKVIRDFAIPLTVRVGGSSEVFYKWFLLNDEDAESRIREMLVGKTESAAQEPQKAAETPASKEEATAVKMAQEPASTEEHIKNGGTQEETKAELEKPLEKYNPKSKPKKETSTVKVDSCPETVKEPKAEKPQKDKEEHHKHKTETKDNFAMALSQFFLDEKIVVEKEMVIKKNTDHEYILLVPSPVGSVSFYCHAKNKKKVTESDLATLLVKAQYHKLPGLMITCGEVTKKALEMLPNELKGIMIKALQDKQDNL